MTSRTARNLLSSPLFARQAVRARRLARTAPLLLAMLAGCANLGPRPFKLDEARAAVDTLVAREKPLAFKLSPYYSSETQSQSLSPPFYCGDNKPVGTDYETLVLTPSSVPGGVIGRKEGVGDCYKPYSYPVEGRYNDRYLYLYSTEGGPVEVEQYAIKAAPAPAGHVLQRLKRWQNHESLLAGIELSSEEWTGRGYSSKNTLVWSSGFRPSRTDPRPGYAASIEDNNKYLAKERATWSQSAAEIAATQARANRDDKGPDPIAMHILQKGNENMAILQNLNRQAAQVSSSTSSTSFDSRPRTPTPAYDARTSTPGDSAASSRSAPPPAYRDLCAEHGLKQALGHDYTDPAGYWGHCEEPALSSYKSGGAWMSGVSPGSVLPLTPWPTRAAACQAATAQMADFERERDKTRKMRLSNAKPISDRSPCVCETGIHEFKKTSNPNGWVCSIFFKEGT